VPLSFVRVVSVVVSIRGRKSATFARLIPGNRAVCQQFSGMVPYFSPSEGCLTSACSGCVLSGQQRPLSSSAGGADGPTVRYDWLGPVVPLLDPGAGRRRRLACAPPAGPVPAISPASHRRIRCASASRASRSGDDGPALAPRDAHRRGLLVSRFRVRFTGGALGQIAVPHQLSGAFSDGWTPLLTCGQWISPQPAPTRARANGA